LVAARGDRSLPAAPATYKLAGPSVSVYHVYIRLWGVVVANIIRINILYERRKKNQQKKGMNMNCIYNNIIVDIVITYLIAPLMKLDMTAMPIPLPDTMNISTNSRFRLKYCATISVEQSLVMPTPIPETDTKRTNCYKHYYFFFNKIK